MGGNKVKAIELVKNKNLYTAILRIKHYQRIFECILNLRISLLIFIWKYI